MDIYSPSAPLPSIPDDLTVPQFIFDAEHECRPVRKPNVPCLPWLIEDETGRAIGEQELRRRTFGLPNGLRFMFGIGEDDVVLIFGRNHVDYPVAIGAVHQLRGGISGANHELVSSSLLEHQSGQCPKRLAARS
ncbi:putative phenylacetyl-CoA ligase [Lyophyllum shimeji]|uniref:Phenylacetyl-CoA ligase n=1 Tax=Lyophyllum shimeji TaxID=47721 RepID=A0A9P3Q1Q4_LYOSH|nr:putative phenylacetyl-CoA ligase [Lyophyllum shimeji]